ncbi:MAG TPA: hypothetical protein PLS90_14340 [Candidatus Sumerlaeota bacterium]|nr:MAG: hypothetical protein BWZ08_01852 [candidate division BRC1 bacterium ADurb.BinA292]HOE97765.1 hypothetical protein [Candidatus Sumerlaeota bacterium]HOR29603.1 hypothetical protein [Candidatus Sumerlaeota bacterium]HPK03623.1 hypothetical protein [Candidatus Sumerlaeota bacterium]
MRVLPSRRRLLWRVAFLVVLLLLMAQSLRVINLEQRHRDERIEADGLLAEARQRALRDDLVATSAAAELERRAPDGWGDAGQIVRRLRDDLLQRPDLIGLPGVLGGRMAFRPDDVHVLNDRWVLAGYEDGHISGWGLFEFSFAGEEIHWRPVESSADEPEEPR